MKIVLICDFFLENLQYHENFLAKYFVKHGHEVTIVTSTFGSVSEYYANKHDKSIPEKTYMVGPLKIIRLKFSLNFYRICRFPQLKKILNVESPGLIYLVECFPNLDAVSSYRKIHPECRVKISFHADYSNSASNWLSLNILHKTIRKYFIQRNLKTVDKIYPVVPEGIRFLKELYAVPADLIQLSPLGYDSDLTKDIVGSQRGAFIREKYNIPKEDIVIFTGGKFNARKKTHVLIEAIIEIADPHIHLLLVGDVIEEEGDYKKKLTDLSAGHANIHFIGWVKGTEVYNYMNASDFSVFPTSQSVLWQQSIGMGLPLIIGDEVALPDGRILSQKVEYLNRHENIVIVEKESELNSDFLSRLIKTLSGDRVLRDKMAAGAAKTASEFLSYDVIVKNILDFENPS